MGAIDTVEPSEEEASQTQSLPNIAIPNGLPLTASAAAAARKRKRGDDPLPPPKPQKKVRATPKTSRAHSKTFASGPPIIPFYIHTRLWEYVDRVKVRNKKAFVALACRYWSLKREARRGAPLLKRLHLEPWTAAAANGQQSDAEKAKKLKVRSTAIACDGVKRYREHSSSLDCEPTSRMFECFASSFVSGRRRSFDALSCSRPSSTITCFPTPPSFGKAFRRSRRASRASTT